MGTAACIGCDWSLFDSAGDIATIIMMAILITGMPVLMASPASMMGCKRPLHLSACYQTWFYNTN
jgi:Ni,Fe-hydrogenase I small subunit